MSFEIKVEPASGSKCVRCYFVKETVSLFGDNICPKCFHIIFKQLFNNEIFFKYNMEKKIWQAEMNPYDKFRELTSNEVLEIISPCILEKERIFINYMLINIKTLDFIKEDLLQVLYNSCQEGYSGE